jgi:cysteine desulfurase
MREVNLDYGAATPLDPLVLEAMLPYMREHFGNPSSGHSLGEKPRKAMAGARENVAALIAADPGRVVFTSSASEANNTAIKGIVAANKKKGNHIIASSIEHFSVLNPLKSLQKEGFKTTLLPVDEYGLIDPAQLAKAITPDTILISIAAANPEIGTVQDLKSLAAVAREKGVPFHTDATAAAGWIPLSVETLGVDAVTLAGDQLYGPKGSAALYVGRKTRFLPLLEGGIQERGLRAGTENVPAIVGLGEAARIIRAEMQERANRLASLRDRLKDSLFSAVPHLHLNGHPQPSAAQQPPCFRGICGRGSTADPPEYGGHLRIQRFFLHVPGPKILPCVGGHRAAAGIGPGLPSFYPGER